MTNVTNVRSRGGWRLAILVVLALATAWQFNATRWIDNGSDALVECVMYAAQNDLGIRTEGFGLGSLYVKDSDIDNDYGGYYQFHYRTGDSQVDGAAVQYTFTPYKSQVGLQGFLFGALASVIRSHKLFWILRMGIDFALELVYLLIFWQLRKRYGLLFAGCFWAGLVFSPSMIFFASSLYWLPVLWYIPMLVGLVCLNHPDKRVPLAVLMYVAVLVKCLCSYEFVSTIMVCAVSFLLVEFVMDKPQRHVLGPGILWMGAACMAAFITAFCIHMYLYSGDGTLLGGFQEYTEEVALRTLGGADISKVNSDWVQAQQASVFSVLKAYFTQPLSGPAVLLVLVLAGGCLEYRRRHGETWKRQALLLGTHFLAPLTWFILAKGHAFIHVYMSIALWYMGFMQVGLYILIDFALSHREWLSNGNTAKSGSG